MGILLQHSDDVSLIKVAGDVLVRGYFLGPVGTNIMQHI